MMMMMEELEVCETKRKKKIALLGFFLYNFLLIWFYFGVNLGKGLI